jgi:hypothetical protein
MPAGPLIGRLDLSRAGPADRRFAAAFTVPATGCASQYLRLFAEPGDVAASVNMEVSGVEISR